MEQLIVNIGSASKKYAVYSHEELVFSCHFEYENGGCVVTIDTGSERHVEQISVGVFERAVVYFLELYKKHRGEKSIGAIGIRIVAPGDYFQSHRIIDDTYSKKLEEAKTLAPIHILATLKEISLLREVFPTTKIVAASDSAFHRDMPEPARSYGLPASLVAESGIRRFGYHGLSVASIVESLGRYLDGSLPEKMLVLHLGSGCSITALRNGSTVDTSMGFTPLEGLLMSTRSGSFDPAIVLALLKEGKTEEEIERLVNKESGLLGMSSSTPDMREIIELSKQGDDRAAKALSMFVYQIVKHIGAYMTVLGGVDAIVFTGTIGERSFIVRERIIETLRYSEFYVHQDNNSKIDGGASGIFEISSEGSKCRIFVVPANESRSILQAMASVE